MLLYLFIDYTTLSQTNQGASLVYHPQLVAVYHQAAGKYTLARDEIQGRLAALDDIHHASRGDDIPSLWLG